VSRQKIAVSALDVAACTVPADQPESDGKTAWGSTTMVVVEVHGGGVTGLGCTYADRAAATLIRDKLAAVAVGGDVVSRPIRLPRWPISSAGGLPPGIPRVKMEVGRHPEADGVTPCRVGRYRRGFRASRVITHGAVDRLPADPARCGGFTGFARAAAPCDAHGVDVSAHFVPQLSIQACAAAWHLRHLEYFHDHVRIESMLFDGVLESESGGVLRPDRDRAGNGLSFKRADAARFAA
jgi:hypothetical protein